MAQAAQLDQVDARSHVTETNRRASPDNNILALELVVSGTPFPLLCLIASVALSACHLMVLSRLRPLAVSSLVYFLPCLALILRMCADVNKPLLLNNPAFVPYLCVEKPSTRLLHIHNS